MTSPKGSRRSRDGGSGCLRREAASKVGQGAGICTRTVAFTGRDAARYTTTLLALPRGFAPRTSAFAERRADFLHLGSKEKCGAQNSECGIRRHALVYSAICNPQSALKVASVAGLAPARTGLKGRVLGLLCIHGRLKWGNGVLEYWSDGNAGQGQHPITPPLQHSRSQRRTARVL